MEREVGVGGCKLLYIEWINNKVLLQSTEDYILYPMINHNEKNDFLKRIYMYVQLDDFALQQKLTKRILPSSILQLKKK